MGIFTGDHGQRVEAAGQPAEPDEEVDDIPTPTFEAGVMVERRCFMADDNGCLWLIDPEKGIIVEVDPQPKE